ncbi:MAG: YjbH domain-containing protein [Candidatus Kapabacteria bacterium]|nr:YjbH domain-containing protein [Ignavibacteriota bacterium]MCW5884641.1 YjbH domain-containing protein [Candidatus Kapabacteria bacterium]
MKKIKFAFIIISLLTIQIVGLMSQGTAGDKAKYETRFVVDMPTAGMLPDNAYSITSAVYPSGGLMAAFDAGFLKHFNAGIRVSGNNIVGDGEISWQWLPGISAKARLFDERKASPAIVLGFESQGGSNYIGNQRFKTHSPGFYIAASKNYLWDLGNLAFHGGVGYSLEPKNEDAFPNAFGGLEQSIGSYLAVNVEYNFQLDEKKDLYYVRRGLLNASLRGSVAPGVTAEIRFRDLLNHARYSEGHERIVALEIIKFFK